MYIIITMKIVKIWKFTVFLTCIVVSLAAIAADPDQPIGQIVAITGKATATGADANTRALALKSPIFLNDKIITGDDSKIQIMFDDDSFVSQGEKSEMTIDEYVYTPKEKEKVNCSMKFARGVFRTVTGKITDLNPERFKVRTKMASIGIRGCELGFRVEKEKEDVYILELPEGKSILIEKALVPDTTVPGWKAQRETLNVIKAGVAVSIQQGVKLQERMITVDELKQLIEQSTANISSSGSSTARTSGKMASGAGGASKTIRETVTDASVTKEQATIKEDEEAQVTKEEEQTTEKRAFVALTSPPETTSAGTPDVSTPTTPPPSPPGPGELPPFPRSGTDWSWGFWADGTYEITGTYVSAADFQSIAAGAKLYNLTGTGYAGAGITHGGKLKFVQGSCALNVQVGESVDPVWDGTFDMNNTASDSLKFGASGSISDGQLSGQLDEAKAAYSLYVNGSSFVRGDVTGQSISGKLVGPGSGIKPITGAAGEYEFQHGGAATVRGCFGSDLSEVP